MLLRFLFSMMFVLSVAIGLSACGTTPPADVPVLSFKDGNAIRLNARPGIEIVDLYRPPLRPPHVEHQFSIVPSQIARIWVRDRLELAGGAGTVKLTIRDGAVTETAVPVKGGLFGMFRRDVARRLTGRLEVQLDFAGVGSAGASTTAIVEATREILEDAERAEVEAVYYEMIRDLADAFDRELTRQIDETFGQVFRGAA